MIVILTFAFPGNKLFARFISIFHIFAWYCHGLIQLFFFFTAFGHLTLAHRAEDFIIETVVRGAKETQNAAWTTVVHQSINKDEIKKSIYGLTELILGMRLWLLLLKQQLLR